MATHIINLTPHDVNVYDRAGEKCLVVYKASGLEARCTRQTKRLGDLCGMFPIYQTHFRDVKNLPDPKPNTFFIVSRYVFSARPDRQDLLIPEYLVRNKQGDVIGCKGLAMSVKT